MNAAGANGLAHAKTTSPASLNTSNTSANGGGTESARQAAAAKYLADIKALLANLRTSNKTKNNGKN